ncbi:hypothetical protein Scep_022478 [Stephania cephalantha]|uniref:Uncharacterized protein n=1 Tax=Stephania cephalantha TaxID=152367 RepID=A0AAP0F688_9MAGN
MAMPSLHSTFFSAQGKERLCDINKNQFIYEGMNEEGFGPSNILCQEKESFVQIRKQLSINLQRAAARGGEQQRQQPSRGAIRAGGRRAKSGARGDSRRQRRSRRREASNATQGGAMRRSDQRPACLKSATTERRPRVKVATTGGIRTTKADGRRTLLAPDGEMDAEAVADETKQDGK